MLKELAAILNSSFSKAIDGLFQFIYKLNLKDLNFWILIAQRFLVLYPQLINNHQEGQVLLCAAYFNFLFKY